MKYNIKVDRTSTRYCLVAVIFTLGLTPTLNASSITSPIPATNLSDSETFMWTAGAGRYILYVGTTAPGNQDIHNSGILSNATTSELVTGISTTEKVYVQLWEETGVGTNSYWLRNYTYNVDADSDNIYDDIDPNPGTYDAPTIFCSSGYTLTLHGSGRLVSLESATLFSDTNTDMSTTEARDISKMLYDMLIYVWRPQCPPQSTNPI